MTLTATEIAGGKTSVHITIEIPPEGALDEFDSPCDLLEHPEAMIALEFPPSPQLRAPRGARLIASSGGDFTDESTYFEAAEIQTDLSLAKLTRAYGEQLTSQGWTRVGEETGKRVHWSEWTFTDDKGRTWDGSFLVLRRFSQGDRYRVTFTIEPHPGSSSTP